MAFPTGLTTVSVLSGPVKAKYMAQFFLTYVQKTIWRQQGFVQWHPDIVGGLGNSGSSYVLDVFDVLAPATTALTETTDPDPVAMSSGQVTITPVEQGNAIQTTKKLSVQSYLDVGKPRAEILGENMARTLDYLCRAVAIAGTWVLYPGSVVARTSLEVGAHKVTYQFITNLVSVSQHQMMPPVIGDDYVSIVNNMLMPDIAADGLWQAVGTYQAQGERVYRGEIGRLAGVRFLQHPYGKVFWGGGKVAQAATTVKAATSVAAGDTLVQVTSATGLAVGDFLVLGTLEASDAEMVKITAISTDQVTIQGIGNAPGNFGTRYAHAAADAVTEAASVAAIPIIGGRSIHAIAAAAYGGKTGRVDVRWKDTNIPERFQTHSWQWYGDFEAYQKHLIRAEVAIANGTITAGF